MVFYLICFFCCSDNIFDVNSFRIEGLLYCMVRIFTGEGLCRIESWVVMLYYSYRVGSDVCFCSLVFFFFFR